MVPRRRKDSELSRTRLIDGAGELLALHGASFSLPDVARHTGVGQATVYRHFADLDALLRAYHERTLKGLIDRLQEAATSSDDSTEMLARVCRAWVDEASRWGLAATYLRLPEGILIRKQRGDPGTNDLFTVLNGVLNRLTAAGVLHELDADFAFLVWVTIFDERVIVDLIDAKRWSVSEIAARLEGTLVSALSPLGSRL